MQSKWYRCAINYIKWPSKNIEFLILSLILIARSFTPIYYCHVFLADVRFLNCHAITWLICIYSKDHCIVLKMAKVFFFTNLVLVFNTYSTESIIQDFNIYSHKRPKNYTVINNIQLSEEMQASLDKIFSVKFASTYGKWCLILSRVISGADSSTWH